MTQPPLLIREIERLAKERGWSTAQIAKHLDLSEKAFRNVCLGHRIVSLGLLSKITELFGKVRSVKELVVHYLVNEYPTYRPSRRHVQGVIAAIPESASYFPRWQIAEWVVRLQAADGVRRGLYLMSSDTSLLSGTVRALTQELFRADVRMLTLQAHARLSASERTLAIAADVLIVERLDHVSDAIARIIAERADTLRPVVVTSTCDREAIPDPILARTLRAITTTVTLTPPTAPPRDSRSLTSSITAHVSA